MRIVVEIFMPKNSIPRYIAAQTSFATIIMTHTTALVLCMLCPHVTRGNGIAAALPLILQSCANFRLSVVSVVYVVVVIADTFTELAVVENAEFVVAISTLPVVFPWV